MSGSFENINVPPTLVSFAISTANTKNIGKKHTEEVEPVQISLFDTMGMVAEQPKKSEVEETLKKLDISNMTPMEAMNQLYELQKKCK